MAPIIGFLRDTEENGVLPAAGGMLDQTAFFSKAFRIFVHAKGKAEKQSMEKAQKESKSKSEKPPTSGHRFR